eukprot:CAMPEP_0182540286 /NCGR_PEP_ID=MMETSP1323-20130603/26808_1 /TAXON_ID=236787 /ORGANISM="Florenciella parvula, Strain RCC1693" /LENGTH=145 /DNA_ID=CAMNT_0024750931 /DNA_START=53 /DNA_END=491 /DNA_ORIENTATION=+
MVHGPSNGNACIVAVKAQNAHLDLPTGHRPTAWIQTRQMLPPWALPPWALALALATRVTRAQLAKYLTSRSSSPIMEERHGWISDDTTGASTCVARDCSVLATLKRMLGTGSVERLITTGRTCWWTIIGDRLLERVCIATSDMSR